jgi:hypothetical protein
MPLPVIVPIVPLLKIVALGSIKTIFLAVGAIFFPRLTLRIIVGSASSLLIPVLHWLTENGQLDRSRYDALTESLEDIGSYDYSAKDARTILFKLTRKSLVAVRVALVNLPKSMLDLTRSGYQRIAGALSGRTD